MLHSFLTLALATIAALCNAQSSSFSPLRPPAIPLAVRSPYLSTWQQAGGDAGNGGYLAGQWPTFWPGQTTGWMGMIRVDGQVYTWMGGSDQNQVFANQTSFEYTSTRSIFTMNLDDLVELTATFLSPVTPNELLRSSLPYSYLDVEVRSLDGHDHDVQVYTDISAEWVSGDHSATAEWSYGVIRENAQPEAFNPPPSPSWPATIVPTTYGTETAYTLETSVVQTFSPVHAAGQGYKPTKFRRPASPSATHTNVNARYADDTVSSSASQTGGVAYHRVWRQQQLEFSEINQQADWGYWYYATSNVNGLTHQSGKDIDVRGQFIHEGRLSNTEDTNYRGIDNEFPTFGFAVDVGRVYTKAVSTRFQISLHQENCVKFESQNGNLSVPCLWTSYFTDETSAVEFFYNDYSTGSGVATSFDSQVSKDSIAAGGQDYLSITSLAVRQAFGSLEYVNSPKQPWVFLKEISSDGNVHTVDVLFPFHPLAIYANATILRYMMDPLFINQEAGYWPFEYSIHDIGSAFPNATGHSNGLAEMQPLEECGDMVIMALAYAQRTGDNAYLAQHYEILKQWNNYLVNDSLIPMNQISTDDFAGSLVNQTNLALKGIIGIEAMAQIANRTGNIEDGQNFTSIAHSYMDEWMKLGIATASGNLTQSHTTLSYGESDSFGLLYNLFADKELGLGLVRQSVYNMQSDFYPTVFNEYGVPLDTRHAYTKTDWEIFAASVASPDTKAQFISTIASWLNKTDTNFAFTDLYDTNTGNYPEGITFIARPVVGGMFALLALDSAPSSGYVQPSSHQL